MDKADKNNAQLAGDVEIVFDLRELLYLLRKNLLWLVLAALVGGVAAFGWTKHTTTPTYTATASLYIVSASNNSVVNLSDLQIGTSLAADYKALVMARPMMESVVANLGLDMSPEALRGKLKISNASGTRILRIAATCEDPQQAADIANETARMTVAWLPGVMECRAPNIVEEAVPPKSASNANYWSGTIRGAVFLPLLCVAVILLRYFLDDTIRSGEELERYFGVEPLAQIPEDATWSDGKKGKGFRALRRSAGRGGAKA